MASDGDNLARKVTVMIHGISVSVIRCGSRAKVTISTEAKIFTCSNAHCGIGARTAEGEPALLAALGNRAACYLRMGKHSLCVDDCGRVLELLPPVPADAASGKLHPMALAKCQLGPRARILVRRGAACCELEIMVPLYETTRKLFQYCY